MITLCAAACAGSKPTAATVQARNPFRSGDTILRAAAGDGAQYTLLVSDVNTCAEVSRGMPGAAPARLVIASDWRRAEVALSPLGHDRYSGCVHQSLVTPLTRRVSLSRDDVDVVVWELR
jgi:hypothetical protein